ncbi:MAG: diacylglycerol/lipid kinase family protein [Janthinobacterium lividum]
MNSLLIVNPMAGQGKPQRALDQMQAALGPLLGSIVVTQKGGDAEAAARGAAGRGFDAVLVAGGDGTVNEVINGLLTSPDNSESLPLGLIPLGTQNVLAAELGMPTADDLDTAAAILRAGKMRRLDAGKAGDRYFVLMAGFGFDAVVVREVLGPVKELIGPAAYAFATLGALAKYHSTLISLTLDGEEIRSEAFLVVVANAASYAYRQIKLAPFASPDDGWLDICVFERPPMDRVGFATQMMAVLARRHLRDPSVKYYRARNIILKSEPPIQGQLDGETFGETPVALSVVPGILPVFVP